MVFLIFGIYHGLLQVLYRAGLIRATEVLGINYYQGLTAHGVINAIFLTAFFNVAFGHVLIFQTLGKIQLSLVKISTFLMFAGAISVLIPIFAGQANVLYTFYPPLKAHPAFYIGLAVFVVGTWVGYWAGCFHTLSPA